MESGSALDLFALLGEGDTLGGNFLVELCDGCDVLVDDRLVDKRPKSFGGLQLRGVGRQINEAHATPHCRAREGRCGSSLLRLRVRRLQAAPRKNPSTLRWKHTRRFRLSP